MHAVRRGEGEAVRCEACKGELRTVGIGNSTALGRGEWYDVKRCLACAREVCTLVGVDVTEIVRPSAEKVKP